MPYIFSRSFLSNPSRVTSLDLDNLQGFFQFKDGYCHPAYTASSVLPETEDEDGYPLLRHDGPMRGHLRPLINRFENLRRLFIRTIGHDDSTDRYYPASREEARYEEIAMFISSTAGTLETLVFEQGMLQEGELCLSTVGWGSRPHQVGRPMDTYFLEFIHPILLSTEWKKLKKITIRGVGGKLRRLNGLEIPPVRFGTWEQYDPAILETAEDSLRTSLGEGVLLEWEPEVGKPFYRWW